MKASARIALALVFTLNATAFAKNLLHKVAPGTQLEKATFAGGCFWHVEHTFRKAKGVVSTAVGYTGGKVPSPSYEQVSAGSTGHAESVQVEYDPKVTSYDELLGIFFGAIDPTTLNRQGPDVGTEYRSAIFVHDEKQKAAADALIKKLDAEKKFKAKIVTEVTPAATFYLAEDYHQQYFEKNPLRAWWMGER